MARTTKTKPASKLPAGYKEIKRPDIEKWEAGDTVSGELVEVRPGSRKFANSNVCTVRVEENGLPALRAFSCPTVLKSKLEAVGVGNLVYIECLGQTLDVGQAQKAWDFIVAVPDPDGEPA